MRALAGLTMSGAVLVLGCATGTEVGEPQGAAGSSPQEDAALQETAVPDDAPLEAVQEAPADGTDTAPEASLEAAPDVAADVSNDVIADVGPDVAKDVAPEAADPCTGVTCTTPPSNVCEDADDLRVYNATGTCSGGTCSYTWTSVACQHGCAADQCNADPCVGVTCATPPANQCSNASYLKVYETPGSCSDGNCSYTSHEEYCYFGCANAACTGNPCAGVSCTTPPASYCSDSTHLVSSISPGTCSNGTCSYASQTQFCAFGCANGACNQDPCAGVTCQTPPAAYCLNASTLRKYDALGSCTSGNCSYGSSDVPCVHGCTNGACKDCTTSAECAAGTWCSNGTCTACTTDAHCGAACSNCVTAGQTCQGGTTCVCAAGTKLCGATCTSTSSAQVGCTNLDCAACPLPAHATEIDCSGPGGSCGFSCDALLHRVPQGSACVCDAAKHFVESAGTCQCEQGYVLQGDTCVVNCAGTVVGSSCYWYESAPVTFDVAETTCVGKGGHLASIADAAENTTVRTLAVANAWFGLRDLQGNKTVTQKGDDCTDEAPLDPLGGRYTDSTSPLYDDVGPCSKFTNSASDMFFRLEVTTQWTWVFQASSSSFDPHVGLWTRGGGGGYTGCLQSFLQCDDNSGSGDDSRIVRTLNPGSYMLIVDAADGWDGTFTLHARRFTFTDDATHIYQNWGSSEPNDASNNEGCAEIITGSGLWNDIACSTTHPAVCKKPI